MNQLITISIGEKRWTRGQTNDEIV